MQETKVEKIRKSWQGGGLNPAVLIPAGARGRFVIESPEFTTEICLIDLQTPAEPDEDGEVMEWLVTFECVPTVRKIIKSETPFTDAMRAAIKGVKDGD